MDILTWKGTTVWPLVFTPVAIQAFKILAASAVETMKEGKWRSEAVEALLGSVGITESLQVMLRRRGNVLPGILALFWLLNPLGSQAIQRLITTEYRNLTSTSQIFYIDSTAERVVSNFLNHIYTEEINALYTASIISTNQIQTSPMDQWGNVKIPMFENPAQNFATEDDGWIPVPTFNVSYTSLIGYPINGIPTAGNSTFNITSSYFVADCEQPVYLSPVAKEYHWADLGNQDPCANTTVLGANRQVNGTVLGTVSFGSLMANPRNITSTSPPRPILFQSNNRPDAIDAVNCTVEYHTMDSRISCNGMNCSVTHMRPSTNALPPSLTPLENCTLAQNIYTSMVEVCGPYALWSGIWPLGSLTELYIYMGANPLDVAGNTTSTQVDLDILPADMVSERLSRILNTFWMASIAPEYIAGGMARFSPHSLSVHPGNQTQAEVVVQENVFVFNDGWLVALLGSSVVLFLLGLVGLIFKYQIPVPTRFNYVSSVEENKALFHVTRG